MSLTRRQEVVKCCANQILDQMTNDVQAEKALYSKRNYAQGNKLKQKDYFYLKMAEILQNGRVRLVALGIPDDYVEELVNARFKICRKNTRGHTGIGGN